MPMTRTTISFTREGMKLIQKAARRQGSSVSQFVREAALMRAKMSTDDNPYPMRALAEQLRALGDKGYALGFALVALFPFVAILVTPVAAERRAAMATASP